MIAVISESMCGDLTGLVVVGENFFRLPLLNISHKEVKSVINAGIYSLKHFTLICKLEYTQCNMQACTYNKTMVSNNFGFLMKFLFTSSKTLFCHG
jgi:hypothetical protein